MVTHHIKVHLGRFYFDRDNKTFLGHTKPLPVLFELKIQLTGLSLPQKYQCAGSQVQSHHPARRIQIDKG